MSSTSLHIGISGVNDPSGSKTRIGGVHLTLKRKPLRASRYRYAQPVCPPNFLDGLPPFELPVRGLWVADTSHYYPEDRGISESIGFGRMMARRAAEAP